MMRHRINGVLCCALVALAVGASAAWAVPLLPGAAILALPEADPTGGVVVAGGVPVPFASASCAGTLTSTVIAGDPSNPWGGLTFTYQLANSPASGHAINRITILDFAGSLTDASYQAPALGLAPTSVDRSLPGDVIGFTFASVPLGLGMLLPGATSAVLVVQTNATAFRQGSANVINGGVVGNIATYVPVPEPLTFSLLAISGLLAWRGRRA